MVKRKDFMFFKWEDKGGRLWESVQPRKTGMEWFRQMRLAGFKVWRKK